MKEIRVRISDEEQRLLDQGTHRLAIVKPAPQSSDGEAEEAYLAFAHKLGADVDEPSADELRERERRASAARHAQAQADAEATVFAERERRETAEVDASWEAWAPILGGGS